MVAHRKHRPDDKVILELTTPDQFKLQIVELSESNRTEVNYTSHGGTYHLKASVASSEILNYFKDDNYAVSDLFTRGGYYTSTYEGCPLDTQVWEFALLHLRSVYDIRKVKVGLQPIGTRRVLRRFMGTYDRKVNVETGNSAHAPRAGDRDDWRLVISLYGDMSSPEEDKWGYKLAFTVHDSELYSYLTGYGDEDEGFIDSDNRVTDLTHLDIAGRGDEVSSETESARFLCVYQIPVSDIRAVLASEDSLSEIFEDNGSKWFNKISLSRSSNPSTHSRSGLAESMQDYILSSVLPDSLDRVDIPLREYLARSLKFHDESTAGTGE